MKLRAFSSAAAVLLFVFSAYAQEREEAVMFWEPVCTNEELLGRVDVLWRVAADKGLTASKAKPRIVIHADKKSKMAVTRYEHIIFYGGFFAVGCESAFSFFNADAQNFIIAHEFGHYLLGHVNQKGFLRRREHESLLEQLIRTECEADVFAGEIIGKGKAAALLLGQEFRTRQTKKGKAMSLLLLPFFGPRDAISSVVNRANLFRNPIGKYERRFWVHGPANDRALSVLMGEVKDCMCDGKPAAK